MKKKYFILTTLIFVAFSGFSQPCSELFISEYVEGSSDNKAIEIYNPTAAPILLTGNYSLQIFSNGNTTPSATIALGGTIVPNDAFVIENPGETLGITSDQQSFSLSFNGDDAIALRNGTTIIDVIGQIGFDPGSEWSGTACTQGTANGTMVRNFAVQNGDPNGADAFDPDLEWTCFPSNDISDLGGHSNNCIASSELQLQFPVGTNIACGFNYDFGNQTLATNTDITVRILNTGLANLNVISLDFATGSQFSIVGAPATPFVIVPAAFQDITIRFTPNSLGVINDTLTIRNSDSNENFCDINLFGTGTSLCGVTTNIIAAQDFESAVSDTWNYTPDHAPIANFWDVTNSLSNIATAQNAANFWGITDLDRSGHTGLNHDITFDPVDVSAFNDVELSFYYYTVNVDSSDDFEYELFYDGISQGLVDISANTSAWRQEIISIPDTVTLVQIRFYADLDAANDQAGLDNFSLSSTSLNTTTWNGTAWNPVMPDNTQTAILAANYNSNIHGGSFETCRLIVNEGVSLNIIGTDYVLVENDISIEGKILVSSNASLVQVNNFSNVTLGPAGTGILQKTANPQEFFSYTYWSSPFVNEIIGEPGSGMDLVPSQRIFEYNASNFEDTDADGFDDNSNDWNIASGSMLPGKGYAAFAQNNGFPFPQAQSYSFDGEFNNGIIAIPIEISPNAGDPNWNLIGNPYPSGIDADVFIANNPDLDGTVYLWTHNSPPEGVNPGPDGLNFSVADYASYNPGSGGVAAGTGGSAPTGIIASGQGFFIEAINAGTVSFDNSMRVTTGNDDFYRATDRIWLDMKSNHGSFSQILITFSEYATNGYDRLYDGKRLDAGSYMSFFTMIEDEDYAIQGRAALTEEEIIPLAFKNLVEGVSDYNISIDAIEGVLEDSEVYLIDKLLNVTHDLNLGAYQFTSEQGEFRERFELQLINTLPVIDSAVNELIIETDENNTLLFSTTNASEISNIQLFDVLGRLLYDANPKEQENPVYGLNVNFNSTIFIAKITLSNGQVLTKKALN